MKFIFNCLLPFSRTSNNFAGYWKHLIVAMLVFGLGWIINDHREDAYQGMIEYYVNINGSYEHKLAIAAATKWALAGAVIWSYGLWLICWGNHVYARANKIGMGSVIVNWLAFAMMLLITWGENTDQMAHFFHRSISVTDNFPVPLIMSAYLLVVGFLLSRGYDLRFSRIFGFVKSIVAKPNQGS